MAAKILVVDDDPNVQRLLTYTVRQEGYEVITANDGVLVKRFRKEPAYGQAEALLFRIPL